MVKAGERIGWLLAGVALAALLAWNPLFERIDRAWQDFSLQQLAVPQQGGAALVLDIDESSLKQMKATHGGWPLPRAVHAEVASRLLAEGAQAVVFNVLFDTPRAGDEALLSVAQRSGRIVFGASGGPWTDDLPRAQAHDAGWPDRAELPAARADTLNLPDAGLLPRAEPLPVGLMSVPWDQRRRAALRPIAAPGERPAAAVAAAGRAQPRARRAAARARPGRARGAGGRPTAGRPTPRAA